MYPEIGNKLIGLNKKVGQASCLFFQQFTDWKPVLLLLWVSPLSFAADPSIDFNRDVRPILSDKCYQCHGPDADNQDSEFRLDSRESALKDLGDYFGIVPGNLEESDLHWRIWEDVEEDLMPPVDSKLALTDEEKKVLDRWIQEGAPYDEHWAFKPIELPELPRLSRKNEKWVSNEIDSFIAARLESEELKPSSMAEKSTLIRRVTLDLTGLPPTPVEVEAFLHDDRPDAWERVVDRLLASPHYGERMALVWLDASRYADSGGYQNDILRSQWPWRDWVIDAYNENMPFDQFTIEQLAGDLLEDATSEQRLATAFNRNHRINNEGGIIPQEFLTEYVADRVETTSTVWLGLTMGCTRCHDHKYDPISQKDFYEMFAFFHNIPEKGKDGQIAPAPNMSVYKGGTEQEHLKLKREVAVAQKGIKALIEGSSGAFDAWLTNREGEKPATLTELKKAPVAIMHLPFDKFEQLNTNDVRGEKRRVILSGRRKDPIVVEDPIYGGGIRFGRSGSVRVFSVHGDEFDSTKSWSWLVQTKTPKVFQGSEGPILVSAENETLEGYRLMLEGTGDPAFYRISFQLMKDARTRDGIEVVSKAIVPSNAVSRLGVSWDGSGKASGVGLYLDGERVEAIAQLDNLSDAARSMAPLFVGARNLEESMDQLRDASYFNGIIYDVQVYDKALGGEQMKLFSVTDSRDLLLVEQNDRTRASLQASWVKSDPEGLRLTTEVKKSEKGLADFEKESVIEVSIMEEMEEPRKTYLLERGAYDHPDESEELSPNTLGALPPMNASMPRNRLGLAQWIVATENPLTARVAVNRYWQMYFGIGLVKTPGDFGSQGSPPSHPDLLNWLASSFVASGWDVKAMQKQMVMSSTYRQSAKVTEELLEKDPENSLLARGPRFRLYGQAIRDQALAASGLLVPEIGGPPVMPYQPEGLWEEVNAKNYKYIIGKGDDLYRRSLYTFWRRTVPPPSMMNFDNTPREICSVSMSRTNTPLQAMNLLNDPQFVETARALAQRMMREGGELISERIDYGHRRVLARKPDAHALDVLASGYADYLEVFKSNPERASEFIRTGASPVDSTLDRAELAAMTLVANVLLNLDETVTKE